MAFEAPGPRPVAGGVAEDGKGVVTGIAEAGAAGELAQDALDRDEAHHLIEAARAEQGPEQVPGGSGLPLAHGAQGHARPAARHVVPILALATRPLEPGLAPLAVIELRQPRRGGTTHVAAHLRCCGPAQARKGGGHPGRQPAAQQRPPVGGPAGMVVRMIVHQGGLT